MKKHIVLLMIGLLSISCSGQNNETGNTETNDEQVTEVPKGSWKVNKEFDENGNLIKYDSIYSWSSTSKYDNLSSIEKDSLIASFKSRFFNNFSMFKDEGFEDIFSQDSLFSKHFFNDNFFESPFGKDFMDIDRMRQQMIERQKKFLEKYQSEFITPEDEN